MNNNYISSEANFLIETEQSIEFLLFLLMLNLHFIIIIYELSIRLQCPPILISPLDKYMNPG